MSEQAETESHDGVASPTAKRFVMRLWADRTGYAIVLIASIVIAPAILAVSAFALSAWVTAPYACGFVFVFVLWSISEWYIRKKDIWMIKSFTDAARYFFEVAKHLEEVGKEGRVICNNDDYEIHLRRINDGA